MNNLDVIKSLKEILVYLEDLETKKTLDDTSKIIDSPKLETPLVVQINTPSPEVQNLSDSLNPDVKIETLDKTLFSEEVHPFLDLLLSPNWPEAVPDFLICHDTEDQRQERAEGILGVIDFELQGKKFLDFGCEMGHVAAKAAETASLSVGYDVKKYDGKFSWEEKKDNFLLTSDFSKLKEYAPFDFILLYDVLDHCENPVDVLNQIHSLCNNETRIFIRFHSWMSRHGCHLYKNLNKAWIQLIFDEKELALMGLKPNIVQKYKYPINTQKKFIEDAKFEVIYEDYSKSVVESFFKEDVFKERFSKQFNTFPEFQMSQSFNDYLIKVK